VARADHHEVFEPGLNVEGAPDGAQAAHAEGLASQRPNHDGGVARELDYVAAVRENQPHHHLEVGVHRRGHVLGAAALVQRVHALVEQSVAADVEEGAHRAVGQRLPDRQARGSEHAAFQAVVLGPLELVHDGGRQVRRERLVEPH
jgi:hypothetical protein